MKEALKEKFEQILANTIGVSRTENINNELSPDIIEYSLNVMEKSYDLAKAESEEIINSQQQLLESMGETNKQLAKRLSAVQHEIELDHTPSKCVNAIKLILNPPQQ